MHGVCRGTLVAAGVERLLGLDGAIDLAILLSLGDLLSLGLDTEAPDEVGDDGNDGKTTDDTASNGTSVWRGTRFRARRRGGNVGGTVTFRALCACQGRGDLAALSCWAARASWCLVWACCASGLSWEDLGDGCGKRIFVSISCGHVYGCKDAEMDSGW